MCDTRPTIPYRVNAQIFSPGFTFYVYRRNVSCRVCVGGCLQAWSISVSLFASSTKLMIISRGNFSFDRDLVCCNLQLWSWDKCELYMDGYWNYGLFVIKVVGMGRIGEVGGRVHSVGRKTGCWRMVRSAKAKDSFQVPINIQIWYVLKIWSNS